DGADAAAAASAPWQCLIRLPLPHGQRSFRLIADPTSGLARKTYRRSWRDYPVARWIRAHRRQRPRSVILCAMSEHQDHQGHGSELSETQLRVRALETILTEKGYVDPAALDRIVEAYETRIGPHIGARVVARAWVDAEFKRQLMDDAAAAIVAAGLADRVGDHLIAVENTEQTHNMVVCTLCSCYPWDVLGLP